VWEPIRERQMPEQIKSIRGRRATESGRSSCVSYCMPIATHVGTMGNLRETGIASAKRCLVISEREEEIPVARAHSVFLALSGPRFMNNETLLPTVNSLAPENVRRRQPRADRKRRQTTSFSLISSCLPKYLSNH